MFLLNGEPLAIDTPFKTPNGTQYPANWLRLSTLEEKEAIGITEVPDPVSAYDQRFYWGRREDGSLIPKDPDQLRSLWTAQTRTTAGTFLAPTDWYVVREYDNGTICPLNIKDWRQAIRTSCEFKISELEKLLTTDSLAAYITGTEYPVWPQLNETQEEPNGSEETPIQTQANDAGIL